MALLHYQRSYKLVPHHATAYNIGVCYEHLGQARLAATYFQTYLSNNSTAPDAPELQQRILLLRQRPSRATLVADGPSGPVELDGTRTVNLPAVLDLQAGTHRVRSLPPGPAPSTFELAFGEPQTIHVATRGKPLSIGMSLSQGWIKYDTVRQFADIALSLRGPLSPSSRYSWDASLRASFVNSTPTDYEQPKQFYLSMGLGTYQRTGWQRHAALAVGYAIQPTWLVELRAGFGYGWYRYLLWTLRLETGFAAAVYRDKASTPAAQFPLVLQLGVAD